VRSEQFDRIPPDFVYTMIGTKLAHYEITSHLGSGGMGDVYQATDTKLGRSVAIKFLPDAFSHDTERVARFQREARVLASLNHPNIAAIYGFEEINGRHLLEMELVPGETLADRIKRGAIPIEEALNIAKQIVEALEVAHEQGVVHRDLKPANIKITPDGKVKVLDFGLAKAMESAPSTTVSNSPTLLSVAASNAGVILGTAGYMSPEQAKGKQVGRRADIWAFGVVLYEMLTSRMVFSGETASETMAQVMMKEPDWSALPKDTPLRICELVRRCLTKDPRNRLQAIGEARIIFENPLHPEPGPTEPVTSRLPSRLGWAAAAVLVIVLAAPAFIHLREQPAVERTLRYTIALSENTTNLHSFAISPNGGLVAIAAEVNGKRQLWLRQLDALTPEPMPGTDDAIYPFWSPDSRYIGFFAQGKLKKIAASGGPAQSLCNAPNGRGGSWNRDDVIVFMPDSIGGIAMQRVSAAGGVPVDVSRTKGAAAFPAFLPDGRHYLHVAAGEEQSGVYLSSLDGQENRRVLADESGVVFAAGRLLFIRENTLMAQPFDAASGQTAGEIFPVAEGVSPTSNIHYAPVSVSETGVLLYESGAGAGGSNQIAWYDRAGKLLGTVAAPGGVFDPRISPDENSVLFRRRSGLTADLWLRDLTRGSEQRFTANASNNRSPVWSPRSDRIAFDSNQGGKDYNLYQKATTGSGRDELLLGNKNGKELSQWSRDGRFIVYSEFTPNTKGDIWVLPMDAGTERKPMRFLHSEFNELFGQLSPDSHWMAYTSDQSGQREVYVRPFPAAEGEWKISIAGGEQPRWRGDGKELFFVGIDGRMMAVTVKATSGSKPSFEAEAPQALFQAHLTQAQNDELFEYDVTADGKRFLLDNVVVGSVSAPQLTVVVNWDAGRRK
jgi:serine/threonine protein kinase/Tol biopolymer transport system component